MQKKILLFFYCFGLIAQTIDTCCGPITIDEPVLLDLIESWPVQRMKKLHSDGLSHCLGRCIGDSRFDNAMRTLAILRLTGAPIVQQIETLLSDVSHTAFSEAGNYLFRLGPDRSYRTVIHRWFLERTGLLTLLEKHDIPLDSLHWNSIHESIDISPQSLYLAQAIRRAIDIRALSMSDLYWGGEEEVWLTLHAIRDEVVQDLLALINQLIDGEGPADADDALGEGGAVAAVDGEPGSA